VAVQQSDHAQSLEKVHVFLFFKSNQTNQVLSILKVQRDFQLLAINPSRSNRTQPVLSPSNASRLKAQGQKVHHKPKVLAHPQSHVLPDRQFTVLLASTIFE
jgi:hypothetical protein